jgi:hypothetical protein
MPSNVYAKPLLGRASATADLSGCCIFINGNPGPANGVFCQVLAPISITLPGREKCMPVHNSTVCYYEPIVTVGNPP